MQHRSTYGPASDASNSTQSNANHYKNHYTESVAVPLSRRLHALVDAEDAERVMAVRWSANWINNHWYAVRVEGGKTIYLHRFVMNAGPGQKVDHRSGDGLDCRKENLRLCTQKENNQNRAPNLARSEMGLLKGVRQIGRRWEARIGFGGKKICLGRFDTSDQAGMAYDAAAIRYFGPFAKTNFEYPDGEA